MAISLTLEQLQALNALEAGTANSTEQLEIFDLLKEIEKNAFRQGIELPNVTKTGNKIKDKSANAMKRNAKIWNLIYRDKMPRTEAILKAADEDGYKDESSVRESYNRFEKEKLNQLQGKNIEHPDGTINKLTMPVNFKED